MGGGALETDIGGKGGGRKTQLRNIKDCQMAIMKLRRELDRVCENIVEIDLDNGNAHCMNMADGIIPDVFEEAIQLSN